MKRTLFLLIGTLILSFAIPFILEAKTNSILKGKLSDNVIIKSEILGYNLQYRVYTPPGYENLSNLPVIYITDGQWYISEGSMPTIMDKLIVKGTIDPVIAVFVDNRNPYNLIDNRRSVEFIGNNRYVAFYKNELVTIIDKEFKTKKSKEGRAIMGLSLGGLNATYFGAMAYDTFNMLIIQSPALHSVGDIYNYYKRQEKLPLKIFLSTGTVNDTEVDARRLKKVFEDKGYDFEYVEVEKGHDWSNWKPLIDDALIYFFGVAG